MMYPTLFLTRNLLREDGVIFASIDDNEVFEKENFIAKFVWNKKSGRQKITSTLFVFVKTKQYLILILSQEVKKETKNFKI